MKNNFQFLILVILFGSCKMTAGEDQIFVNPETVYKLRMNPEAGSKYYYDIINTTEIHVEIEEKQVSNINKATVGINYNIDKDSAGNFIFKILYDKVQLYLKNGDNETEADADNAQFSINPVEKMLGSLKGAILITTVSPAGEVQNTSGFNELSERLMAGLDPNDLNARKVAQNQLDKVIGEGMVQRNLDQLFRMFPDSSVHIGQKWKLTERQNGDINFNVKSFYLLKAVREGIAFIEAESQMESDPSPIALMGQAVTPDLKGTQKAAYRVEIHTGMLIDGHISSEIFGKMQMLGKEFPIRMKTKSQITGRRIQLSSK